MCQSGRLFSYVIVTKTKHNFFSGASTIRLRLHGSGLIFEKTKLYSDRLSFTREPRNRESLWTATSASFWPDQKKVKIDDRTVPLLRGLLLTVQVFAQFAG